MYLRLLRDNRDFRLLYLGTLISLGGDWFLTVALLDLVLSLTGSATLASLMLLCQMLPIFFFTPIAGHIIDKVDRRKLMIVVDLARTIACLLPLIARTPALLPFAYLGVILISIGSAYFEPASQAALPNIVAPEELGPANVLMGSTWGTMLAVGAAIGGLVTMRFGRDLSFVVDSASFLLSAGILWMMRARFSEERKHREHPPLGESIRETVRYAKTHPRVLALLAVKGGYGTGAGTIAMLSVFGKEVFNEGAFGIGLLFAARGLGALVGPFVVRLFVREGDAQYRAIAVAILFFGAGYAGLAFTKSLLIGLIFIFIAHLGGGAAWQVSTYGLQKETEDAIRGRVFSADYGFVTLTMALSCFLAGAMSDRFGPTFATASLATLCIVMAVVWSAWTWRLWRHGVAALVLLAVSLPMFGASVSTHCQVTDDVALTTSFMTATGSRVVDGVNSTLPSTGVIDDNCTSPNRATQPCWTKGIPTSEGNVGHGTSVASIAAGNVVGVAPLAKIVSIRAVATNGGSTGKTVYDGLRAVLQEAYAPGAPPFRTAVVNMSFFFAFEGSNDARLEDVHQLMQTMTTGADANGNADPNGKRFVFAVAAMNVQGGCPQTGIVDGYPALWGRSIDGVITVGGITESNDPWSGACGGPAVELLAPATNILSAFVTAHDDYRGAKLSLSGTSFSTAIVSGLAARLLASDPTLTPRRLIVTTRAVIPHRRHGASH